MRSKFVLKAVQAFQVVYIKVIPFGYAQLRYLSSKSSNTIPMFKTKMETRKFSNFKSKTDARKYRIEESIKNRKKNVIN
jgi:hypothetical protein